MTDWPQNSGEFRLGGSQGTHRPVDFDPRRAVLSRQSHYALMLRPRQIQVRLRRPGLYRLICLKPGHAAKGMRATLRVR